MAEQLSVQLDAANNAFTGVVKDRLLASLPGISTEGLEWLLMEWYQLSSVNRDLLLTGVNCTKKLAEPRVSAELQRNVDEEDGHVSMYRQGLLGIGTDVDRRVEFPPTTRFLTDVAALCAPNPSRALGALYATETAAIFEHGVLDEICRRISERRDIPYEGSLIKRFHDLHLEDGVEQGHKDGLAAFVDLDTSDTSDTSGTESGGEGEPIEPAHVREGALEAITVMQTWWDSLLARLLTERADATA